MSERKEWRVDYNSDWIFVMEDNHEVLRICNHHGRALADARAVVEAHNRDIKPICVCSDGGRSDAKRMRCVRCGKLWPTEASQRDGSFRRELSAVQAMSAKGEAVASKLRAALENVLIHYSMGWELDEVMLVAKQEFDARPIPLKEAGHG